MLRLIAYTLAQALFPPLFYFKNRWMGPEHSFSESLFRSKGYKRVWKLMKQKKILAAIEMFWSSWNPVVTEETTKPLYRLLGGNKRPVFATMITFLYTGIFLHAFGAGIIWLYVFAFISKDFHFMKGFFFGSCIVVIAYFVIGMLVAFSKYRKKRST